MAYQPNIPLATDRLKDSQADLQGNFQEVNTYLNVNHTAIDGTADQGKHTMVTLTPQVAIPPTSPNQWNIYNAPDGTGANQIFLTPDGINTQQLTGSAVTFVAPTNIEGWIPIVPGFYMKWMTHTIASLPAGLTPINIPYPGSMPIFTSGTSLVFITKLKPLALVGSPYDIYWDTNSTNATQIGVFLINDTGAAINNIAFTVAGIGI